MGKPKKLEWSTYIFAGGAAGAIARTAIAPIERVKIIYQIDKTMRGSYSGIPKKIIAEEGFFGLWRGNSAAVLRVVPYMSKLPLLFPSIYDLKTLTYKNKYKKKKGAQFTFLEFYKKAFRKVFPTDEVSNAPNIWLTLAAGSCAGVTAVSMTYPLDVVRARMAMQQMGVKKPKYSSFLDCLIKYPQEKGIGRMYRGLGPTLLGVGPYAGIKFFMYDILKPIVPSFLGGSVGAGAIAGVIAQTFVYPFDVIRRRNQTHGGEKELYKNTWDAIKTIYREEGLRRGLYKGLSLNYLKTAPNTALYLSLYDFFKAYSFHQKIEDV